MAHQKQPSPLADEADIILSPATGILCTTLQKIKQRALPGQVGHAGVRERIQTIAARYERLIVYVSEGKSTNTGPVSDLHALDDRDCEALVSLTGFAATLNADVQITYVAGGEEELARWIVAATVRFGVNAAGTDGTPEGVKLLQDETLVSFQTSLDNNVYSQTPVGALSPSSRLERFRCADHIGDSQSTSTGV